MNCLKDCVFFVVCCLSIFDYLYFNTNKHNRHKFTNGYSNQQRGGGAVNCLTYFYFAFLIFIFCIFDLSVFLCNQT